MSGGFRNRLQSQFESLQSLDRLKSWDIANSGETCIRYSDSFFAFCISVFVSDHCCIKWQDQMLQVLAPSEILEKLWRVFWRLPQRTSPSKMQWGDAIQFPLAEKVKLISFQYIQAEGIRLVEQVAAYYIGEHLPTSDHNARIGSFICVLLVTPVFDLWHTTSDFHRTQRYVSVASRVV